MSSDKGKTPAMAAMEKQKKRVDAAIEAADEERGVAILLTGNGKGKTSSAFGMIMRALGYGHRVGVVQFIKGPQLSGEELYLRDHCPSVEFYQMGTGFTWDTQDRSSDMEAAERTWAIAQPMLENEELDLVVLDELTYMLYDYLSEQCWKDLGPSTGTKWSSQGRWWFSPARYYGYSVGGQRH